VQIPKVRGNEAYSGNIVIHFDNNLELKDNIAENEAGNIARDQTVKVLI
jgi:hypothetical protein